MLGIGRLRFGIVLVGAHDLPDVDLVIHLGGIQHAVTDLGFVNEAKELPAGVWIVSWLPSGANDGEALFEGVTVGTERGQVAHFRPAEGNDVVLREQLVRFTCCASVYSPECRA